MTADSYLESIIAKYAVNEIGVKSQVEAIYPTVQKWGGTFINESIYSGSIAKGTAISIGTDADVFISLTSATSGRGASWRQSRSKTRQTSRR
ncbi:MAG: hypothetical protein HUK40_05750 [Desulfobacter sp.]|nr:hypothetical protein [Desulfobacter sp.]